MPVARRIRRQARAVGIKDVAGRAPDLRSRCRFCRSKRCSYRLCGDRSPLHSDPEFAAAARLSRPILHGLCAYGMTCKAIVDALLDSMRRPWPATAHTLCWRGVPGETLTVNVWKDGRRLVASVVATLEATLVLSSGAGVPA